MSFGTFSRRKDFFRIKLIIGTDPMSMSYCTFFLALTSFVRLSVVLYLALARKPMITLQFGTKSVYFLQFCYPISFQCNYYFVQLLIKITSTFSAFAFLLFQLLFWRKSLAANGQICCQIKLVSGHCTVQKGLFKTDKT